MSRYTFPDIYIDLKEPPSLEKILLEESIHGVYVDPGKSSPESNDMQVA